MGSSESLELFGQMRDKIPIINGGKSARELINEIFSREMLGSVLVGVSAGKIVEKIILLYFSTTAGALVGWILAFIVFVLIFIYWDRVEKGMREAVEDAQG